MKNKRFLKRVKVAITNKECENRFTKNNINMEGEYNYLIFVRHFYNFVFYVNFGSKYWDILYVILTKIYVQ